jgi:uncharacterized protein with PQ loop repeat
MHPNPLPAQAMPPAALDRLMNGLSLFTLGMTVPQVVSVWSERQATGVSLWSWSAYLVSAIVWLIYGLRKGDKHIYLPCVGWIVLDAAIVAGLVLRMHG